MEITKRSFEFRMKTERDDEENKGVVVGRPIVYDKQTDIGGMFAEVIDKGALDKADLKDVRFCVNHDLSKIPLARSRNNNENSTMQMTVDSEGMYIRVKLDTENNKDAAALYSAINREDITGISFAFTIDGFEWENLESDYPTRHITSIGRVFEVSAVTFPAYEDTSIEIAARDKEALDSARSVLESARRSAVDTGKLAVEKLRTEILGGLKT